MNVIDSKNISYEVLSKLGEGSQGVIYLLEGKRYVAKLFNKNIDSSSIKSKINFLINLGLDKAVFAIPLRKIKQPKNGYIAEFASGMTTLSSLRYNLEGGDFVKWYNETGGLLKRYKVLIKLASLIRKLHSRGLIYCDLSLNNVFISEKVEKDAIFLIDLDNLRYRTSIVNNIYTPFYGAPEVVSNAKPNSIESDNYSFAVLAYELLTLNHPLIGDYISDGEPELEEKALLGNFPWVDHSEDSQNKRSTGLPSKLVIPDKLLQLFKRNFEEGLHNPSQRPSMTEWFEVLNLSINELLKCGNIDCGFTYPYNNLEKCGLCEFKAKKVTRIQIRIWEEVTYFDKSTQEVKHHFELQPDVYEEILIDENTPKGVTALNFLLHDINPLTPLLKVEYLLEDNQDKILLSPLSGIKFKISPRIGLTKGKKTIILDRPRKIRVVDPNRSDKLKYMLHLKDLNTSQRVLTID